jgi:hypothetical protein
MSASIAGQDSNFRAMHKSSFTIPIFNARYLNLIGNLQDMALCTVWKKWSLIHSRLMEEETQTIKQFGEWNDKAFEQNKGYLDLIKQNFPCPELKPLEAEHPAIIEYLCG